MPGCRAPVTGWCRLPVGVVRACLEAGGRYLGRRRAVPVILEPVPVILVPGSGTSDLGAGCRLRAHPDSGATVTGRRCRVPVPVILEGWTINLKWIMNLSQVTRSPGFHSHGNRKALPGAGCWVPGAGCWVPFSWLLVALGPGARWVWVPAGAGRAGLWVGVAGRAGLGVGVGWGVGLIGGSKQVRGWLV